MKTIYVLTSEYNDYDQHGEYFVAAFPSLPTIEKLAPIVSREGGLSTNIGEAIAYLEFLRRGGGRKGNENPSFNLREVALEESE